MNLGVVFQEFMQVANKHHILLPQSVTMLGRGVMTIEGVLRFVRLILICCKFWQPICPMSF